MRDVRSWSTAIVVWLFGLYNIERLDPLGLSPLIYPFSAAVLVACVLASPLAMRRLGSLIAAGLLFLGAKTLAGEELFGAAFAGTSLELLALGVTTWLGLGFGRVLSEFREASTNVMIQHLRDRSTAFDVGQGRIYEEIRRARRHGRPAALVSVEVDSESVRAQPDRLLLEIQKENLERYAMARFAEILDRETSSYGIITQRDRHFVTLLPETRREDAERLVGRLAEAAERELGVKLRAGYATFPEDEVTLSSLIERAEQRRSDPSQMSAPPEDQALASLS